MSQEFILREQDKRVSSSISLLSATCQKASLLEDLVAQFRGRGKGLSHPRWTRTPLWHLLTLFVALVSSVAASTFIVQSPLSYWLFLAPSLMVTVHAARRGLIVICHHGVHGNLFGNKALERVVVEILSTLFFIQGFDGYYRDHVQVHHSARLATLDDLDLQFLLKLGFRPGMPPKALWRRLYWTMVSPYFHMLFVRMRLKANFVDAPLYRRAMSGGYVVLLTVITMITNAWLPLLLAWLLPLIPLYQVSALLQFSSEHRWLQVPQMTASSSSAKLVLARLTFGRFVGDPIPRGDLPLWQWFWAWHRWVLRLLLLHIPARLTVLVGDLPQHDWHHRQGKNSNWSNACFERERDLQAGCPGWPQVYEEVYGLDRAIDTVFTGLANLPPLPLGPRPSDTASKVVLGM